MAATKPETETPERFAEFASGDVPNVAGLRARLGLSQERFAAMLEVSPLAVQNWEAGYPVHPGPARVLLRLAAHHPHVFLDAMAKTAFRN